MFRPALLIASFAALVPLSAIAQLQVFMFDGTNDTPLSSLTTIGTVAPGDTLETRFHIRNMGVGPVSLNSLVLTGAAFTITSAPSLPYVIAPYAGPTSEVEFDTNFSPEITGAFGAFLGVNSLNFALQGISAVSATVTFSGSQIPLTAGTAINFGAVAVGSSQTQSFVLSNSGNTSLTVNKIAVTGTGFSGPIGINLPIQLGAGQAAPFQVIFIPQAATAYQGTLAIDGRTFPLTGQGSTAPAQLQFFKFDGTNDTPVTQGTPLNVGTAAPGDTITTRFHIRNTGEGPVTLQQPSFSGTDFSIQNAPSFPYVLSPYVGLSSEAEIDVAFSPTVAGQYSATLAINSVSVNLEGTAAVSAVVTVGNGTTPLTGGTSVNFGSVAVGSSQTQTLVLSNSSSAAITVSSVSVSGSDFSLAPGLTLPVSINPSQTISFQVSFAPQAGMLYQGTLSVDTLTFPLIGQGLAATLPAASLVFGPGTVASGQTNNISIALASASQTAGTGTLTMSFQPSVVGATEANDPAIQFFPVPAYRETVTIQPGATSALIDGQPNMQFQTGTTAGTITFTLTLENNPPQQATLTIPPGVITLDEVTAVRIPGQINVALDGFDNTYSASQLSFTFYDLNSNALPQGVISLDATSDFQPYFSTTTFGGMFQLLLNFPVTGNTAEIGFVSVGITNSVGTTTTTQPVAITN